MRTRMTVSPRAAAAAASSAVKYTWPTAAPGDAARPLASDRVPALGELRVQHLVERGRSVTRPTASSREIFQSSLPGHVDRHAERRRAGALADPGLQHPQLALRRW